MIKKIILLGITLIIYSAVSAQSVIAEIETRQNNIDSLLAFPSGDSLLLCYKEGPLLNKQPRRYQYKWISAAGSVRSLNYGVDIFAISSFNENLYCYYFDPTNKSELKAFTQTGKKIERSINSIKIPGDILNVYVADDLYILSFLKDEKQITFFKIRGVEVLSRVDFVLPEDYYNSFKKFSGFKSFVPGAYTNLFKGWYARKIYHGEKITITIEDEKKDLGLLSIIELDIDKRSVKFNQIKIPVKGFYSTFVYGDTIFISSVIDDRPMINTIKKSTLEELPLSIEDSLADSTNYITERIGAGNKINRYLLKPNFFKLNKATSKYIVPFQHQSKLVFQCGYYFDESPNGLLLAGINPIASMLLFATTYTLFSSFDSQGTNRYLYFELENNKLSINKTLHPRSKADDFEIENQGRGIKYSHKYYVDYKNGLAGVYVQKKSKKITLVNFE